MSRPVDLDFSVRYADGTEALQFGSAPEALSGASSEEVEVKSHFCDVGDTRHALTRILVSRASTDLMTDLKS